MRGTRLQDKKYLKAGPRVPYSGMISTHLQGSKILHKLPILFNDLYLKFIVQSLIRYPFTGYHKFKSGKGVPILYMGTCIKPKGLLIRKYGSRFAKFVKIDCCLWETLFIKVPVYRIYRHPFTGAIGEAYK